MVRFANKFGTRAYILKIIREHVYTLPKKRLTITDINALESEIRAKIKAYEDRPLPQVRMITDNRVKLAQAGFLDPSYLDSPTERLSSTIDLSNELIKPPMYSRQRIANGLPYDYTAQCPASL